MLRGRFRHLPIVERHAILGLLDVVQLLQGAVKAQLESVPSSGSQAALVKGGTTGAGAPATSGTASRSYIPRPLRALASLFGGRSSRRRARVDSTGTIDDDEDDDGADVACPSAPAAAAVAEAAAAAVMACAAPPPLPPRTTVVAAPAPPTPPPRATVDTLDAAASAGGNDASPSVDADVAAVDDETKTEAGITHVLLPPRAARAMERVATFEERGKSFAVESRLAPAATCFSRALAFLPVSQAARSFLQQPSCEGRLRGLRTVLAVQARVASHYAQVLSVQGDLPESVRTFQTAVNAAELHLWLGNDTLSEADAAASVRKHVPGVADAESHGDASEVQAAQLPQSELPPSAVGKLLGAVCEGLVEVAQYEDLLSWVPRLRERDAQAAAAIVDMLEQERTRLKETGNDLYRERTFVCSLPPARVHCWAQAPLTAGHGRHGRR